MKVVFAKKEKQKGEEEWRNARLVIR